MPFYRKKIRYEEAAPIMQKFRQFLRLNAICAQELSGGNLEVFLCDDSVCQTIYSQYSNIYGFMIDSRFLTPVPFDDNYLGIYINEAADGNRPTVSKTHVRLPKLSHLITLTPNDFFLLLNIIATAKNTPAGDALSLNPGACGIETIESSILTPFFTKLRTNYRLNPDLADRKWTEKADIRFMAEQYPNRDSQLMAMQYFTAKQNNDLMVFPLETVIDLDLSLDVWEQVNDDYCAPPGAANPMDIR